MKSEQFSPLNEKRQGFAARVTANGVTHGGQPYNPDFQREQQVVAMLAAFRATGGLLPLDAVVARLGAMGGPDADELGNWIDSRSVIAFEWRSDLWLPMFQFSRTTKSVHESLRPVLRELAAVYDGWDAANWFALPNAGLADRTPVDMLVHDLPAVWYAARVDRFIALGETSWDKRAPGSERTH